MAFPARLATLRSTAGSWPSCPRLDLLEKLKEGAAYDSESRAVWIKTPDQNFPLQAIIAK